MLEQILKFLDSCKEHQFSAELRTYRARIVSSLHSEYFSHKIKPYFATMHAEGIPFTDFANEPKQVIQIKEVINALYHGEQAFLGLETADLRNMSINLEDFRQLYSFFSDTFEHSYKACYLLTHLDIELSEIFANEIKLILPLFSAFQNFADNHIKEAMEFTEKLKSYPYGYTAGLVSGIAVDQMRPTSSQVDYSFLTQLGAVLPGYLQQFTQLIHQYSPQPITRFKSTLDSTRLEALRREGFYLLNHLQNLQDEGVLISAKVFNYANAIRRVINLSMSILEQLQNLNSSSQDIIRENLAALKYEVLAPLFALADRLEDEALLAPGTLSTPLMEKVKPLYDFLIEYASMAVDFSEKGRELLTVEDDRFVYLRLREAVRRATKAKLNRLKIEQARADLTAFYNILAQYNPNEPLYYYFAHLPEETKKELAIHYKLLEPYVKKIDSELNNRIIQALTIKYEFSLKDLSPFCDGYKSIKLQTVLDLRAKIETALASDYNTQTFHISLNEDLISEVHQRADLSLFSYDRKSNVRNCNEAAVLKIDPSSANTAPLAAEQAVDPSSSSSIPLTAEQAVGSSSANTALLPAEQTVDPSSSSSVPLTAEQADVPSSTNDFNFDVQGGDCYLTNTAPLTAEQAFELYQFYADKLAKLERAKAAFIEFMKLIRVEHPKPLLDIDKGKKARLRSLYCRFQPYITDVVTPDYETKIIANLAEYSDEPGTKKPDPLSTRYFLGQKVAREQTILATLENLSLTLQPRASLFRLDAGLKYRAIAHARELRPDETTIHRAGYVLKDTKYSEAISAFRNSVLQLSAFFNTRTREQLKPEIYYISSGVPYPELESNLRLLKESKQILGIKYIHNALYHIEQVSKHMEALNDKSMQSVYVYHLYKIYNHLDAIVLSGKELRKDPYLVLLTTDISNWASEIYQMLLTRSEPYRMGPEMVHLPATSATRGTPDAADTSSKNPQQEEVQYGGIWYPLNAFMLAPAHIQSLIAEEKLTQAKREAIQAHTKQITLDIEAVIRESGSYFQLFLKTPVMQDLFLELRKKLKEFSTITREAVLDNLAELNTEHFAKMLLEADKWEDRMGLKPGLLSGPMKFMLDEFYRGLIQPLGFVSQKHIALVSSLVPIEKRIAQVRERKAKATQEKAKYLGDYTIMTELMKLIATYDQFNKPPAPHPAAMQALEQDLMKAYKRALPILKKQRALFTLLKEDESKKSTKLDRLLSSPVTSTVDDTQASTSLSPPLIESSYHQLALALAGKPQSQDIDVRESTETEEDDGQPFELTENIEAHCQLVFNYYQGHINTHDTDIATAEEKAQYLVELRKAQKTQNQQFVINYVQKAIARQLEAADSRYIGLLHVRHEYNNKLKEYLESQQEKIIDLAKRAVNIDDCVQSLMATNVSYFDQEHYHEYAHLESVMVSLNAFQSYLAEANTNVVAGRSYFETAETLLRKTELIDSLELIAKDSKKSIKERLQAMAVTDADQFQTTMLAHHEPQPYTLAWLIQQISEFLSLLCLYKPGYERCIGGFDNALKNPPTEQALNRWRLTAPPKRRYALPPQILAVRGAEDVVDQSDVNEPNDEGAPIPAAGA